MRPVIRANRPGGMKFASQPRAARREWRSRWSGAGALALVLAAGGCTTPINQEPENALRRAVVDAVRRELADAQTQPDPLVTQRAGSIADLRIPPDKYFPEELARMGGPDSYDPSQAGVLPLGLNLLGQDPRTARVSLERAMRSAVANNLELQFAALGPAVAQAQITQAEAAFDWVLFANIERSWLDDQNLSGTATISRSAREIVNARAGLRRQLGNGAAFSIQQDISYTRVRQNGTIARGSQNTSLNWSFQYDQPLMRDFGSDVALAPLRLARNAERNQIALLERQLLQLTRDVEATYWQLWQAYHDVMILQRLVDRGEEISRKMEARDFGVNPANIANARARVIERQANVIRAQNTLRRTSDRLKTLMNDPAIPTGSEILILPVDRPVDEAITYNLGEALFTAIERRPEVAQSVLSIDDTGVRQLVANNQRRPQLDLRLQARLNGLEDTTRQAYERVAEGDFGSWVIGFFYEQPLGNRDAEAVLRRRRLERSQAVISYQNTIQAVTSEVKTALDNVGTNYQLIIRTRLARIAASEVLRSLRLQSELITDVSPERLDLELGRQEALANSERDEIATLVSYNISIAEWYAAQGTALERNRIKFVVPGVDESPHWPYLPGETSDYAKDWWARHSQSWSESGSDQAGAASPDAPAPTQPAVSEPVATEPAVPQPAPAMLPIQPAPGGG